MKISEKLDRETNHDYAFRIITENIINLELKPGTLLSEQDIAVQLNMSRTPVHEALQEISKTKIVEILPQRGSLVSLIDLNLIKEAVFMRTTIECVVSEQACKIATNDDMLALEENVNLQEFYKTKNNADKIIELDNEFHKMMYKIDNKMQCYDVIKKMNIHHDRYRELRLHSMDFTQVIEDHKKILAAFLNRESSVVKELIQEHLNRLYVDEKLVRQKYPDYFTKE